MKNKLKGDMNVELFSRRMLDEARECIEKKDAMQASEKLYKASEESLKLLSAKFRLPEYEDAKKRGRWTTSLLFSAVRKLSVGGTMRGSFTLKAFMKRDWILRRLNSGSDSLRSL